MKKQFQRIQSLQIKQKISLSRRLCKLFEEVGELAQAINAEIGIKNLRCNVRDRIVEEMADTIQCVFCLAAKLGIQYDEIRNKLEQKNQRWQKKYNIKVK